MAASGKLAPLRFVDKQQMDYEAALRRDLRDARRRRDYDNEAKTLNQLGEHFNSKGEYSKALKFYRQDYEVCCKRGLSHGYRTLRNLGEVRSCTLLRFAK